MAASPVPSLQTPSGPSPELQAALRHGLRLAYSALREGLLPGTVGITVVTVAGLHQTATAEGLLALLYTLDPRTVSGAHLRWGERDLDLSQGALLANTVLRDQLEAQSGALFRADRWQAFLEEFENSRANEALSLAERTRFHDVLRTLAGGKTTLVSWLQARPHLDQEPLWLRLGSFSGHRTHPASKMRLRLGEAGHRSPLSEGEIQNHAPEFGARVRLPVLAVRADRVTARAGLWHGPNRPGPADYRAYFEAGFPVAAVAWRNGLGPEADDFLPLPIHPLQDGEIRTRFRAACDVGDIRWLEGAALTHRPTLSFRTMVPDRGAPMPVVKTSLNIQMTSEVRTLAPARTFNAPVYSDILLDILRTDTALARSLRIIPEPASIYWGPEPDPARRDYGDSFHLAAVFKANPAEALAADEMAVPLNALFAVSPLSGERILVDFMRQAGASDWASVMEYGEAYAAIVLQADLGMLVRHGVALESHQQNVDMVFGPDARPRALLYRDISDGILAYAPLLEAMGWDLAQRTHPAPKILRDDVEGPLRQVSHTTFASHLIPFVTVISRAFSVPEEVLFARLRDLVQHQTDRDETAPAPTPRVQAHRAQVARALRRAVLDEDLQVKCLLTMRALQTQTIRYTTAPNPLKG